jgi:hypothetical protein
VGIQQEVLHLVSLDKPQMNSEEIRQEQGEVIDQLLLFV